MSKKQNATARIALGNRYWSIAPFFEAIGQAKYDLQTPWVGEVSQTCAPGRESGWIKLVTANGSVDNQKTAFVDLNDDFGPITLRTKTFATKQLAQRAYLDWLDSQIEDARESLGLLIARRDNLGTEWAV